MSITILLADDHQVVRQGLKSLLDRYPDLKVVGEAADGRTAVRLAKELSPDVVVMDIGMPDLNGIEATRQLAAGQPVTKIVALSMHADRRFASEMLKAGAKAYLVKDGAFEELADAIRTVMADRVYLSPRVAGTVVDDLVHGESGGGSAFARLSPREREVLQLMAEGRATKEIAMDLHVSVKTVETHRRQVMEKLNLFSVAELTKYAIREGLTALDP
jgi:DNA-binding NarL/FixJ family response regulator